MMIESPTNHCNRFDGGPGSPWGSARCSCRTARALAAKIISKRTYSALLAIEEMLCECGLLRGRKFASHVTFGSLRTQR